jgi:predicted PurR-regulated permease PerM
VLAASWYCRLAVALEPLVQWLQARGLKRWMSATLLTVVVLTLTVGFVWMTWSSLVEQSQLVGKRFGELYGNLERHLPERWQRAADENSGQTLSAVGPYLVSLANSAFSALTIILLGFVLTFYLLIDGQRVFEWFLAFVPLRFRPRMERTLSEGRGVLSAYMVGQFITSGIAAVTTFVALTLMGVPAALFLALLAGLSDFVPVVGFVLTAIPAVVLGLAVSGKTALGVVAFYIAYNAVESYVISPRAYGSRMRLSDFAVVVAFVVGAELAGVIGAVISLPLAALYPTVEQIWLRRRLPEETLREHRELEQREEGE